MRIGSGVCVVLATVLLWSGVSRAATPPLSERVPADALIYIGWRGADAAGEAYAGTHLQGVIGATNLGELFTQTLPAMIRQAAENEMNPQEAADAAKVMELLPLQWSRPWAAYVRVVPGPGDVESRVRLGMMMDAGKATPRVRAAIQELIASAPPPPPGRPAPELFDHDGLIGLVLGDGEAAALAALANPITTHLNDEAVVAAVEHPMLVAYCDVRASLALVDAGVDAAVANIAQTDGVEKWRAVRDALELGKLDRFVFTSGFSGKGWSHEALLAADGVPRVLSMVAGEPIRDEDLRVVPRTATWMAVTRFDVAKLLDVINEAAVAAGLEQARIRDGLDMANAVLGTDLEAGLLRQLGSAWVMYNDPAVAGPMGLGAVVVNSVGDEAAVRQTLTALKDRANALLAAREDVPFRFKTTQQGELSIHTLTFPMVAPSWAVTGGRLYVALFPQAIMTADLYAKQENNSILQNEKFQAVRERLGAETFTGMSYTDLPQTAPVAYQQYLMLSQFMVAMTPDAQAPAMLLPPLGAVLPHVEPAGSVTWVDIAGIRYRTISPFPGSVLLNPQGMMSVSGGALGVGIMLPALGAARRTARQMQTNTQARGIHQAAVMYAQGNKSRLPDTLQPLYHDNYFTIEYLVAPTSGIEIPADFETWPATQKDAWIQQNASFVLLPGLTETLNTEEVALFAKPSHTGGHGTAVTFQDNHTVWMLIDEADALVRAQTGKSMDELTRMSEQGELKPGTIENNVQRRGAPKAPPF